MTTQEAIEKLKNYYELEGKYNEALARIDEYERERTEVLAKIEITKEDIKKAGIISGALNSAINMLKPLASNDDDFEVGDVIKDVRDGQKAVYLGTDRDDAYTIIFFSPDREMFEIGTVGYLKYWSKTGKHYPQIDIALLAEILAELRGENDE